MNVGFALVKEVLPNFIRIEILVVGHIFVFLHHSLHNVVDILSSRKQVWNLTIVKDIVNVFKECLDDDLGVVKEEDSLLLFNTAV